MPEVLDRPVNSPAGVVVPASTALAGKLAALRRRQTSVLVITGLARVAGAAVLLLGAGMLLDWWLDFPWSFRALVLGLDAALLGWWLVRYVLAPLVRQPDDDTFALMVEKGRPEFRSRLIASIQLTRPGAIPPQAASDLVRAMIGETEQMARPLDFTEVVSLDDLKKFGGWAATIVAAGLMLAVSGRDVSVDLFKRALLSHVEVPRKTRVTWLTQNVRVGRGDPVTLEAVARGIIPKAGRLFVRSSFMSEREYPMEKDKRDQTRFNRTLESVQSTFSYYVKLNDGESGRFEVTVVPRPIIAKLECEQIPPGYSKLPQVRRSLGDLSLLAGSRLRIVAPASKDLRSAGLKLVGLTNEMAMAVNPQKPRELSGEVGIPAKGLTGFSLFLTDTEGMESKDSAVYHIEIVPDKAPTVRILYPDRKEELATRDAILLVAFQAKDDFQVAKARIRYKAGEAEDAEIKAIELDLGTNALQEVRSRFEWRLAEFKPPLAQGSRIEFWIEVEDNNDVTGPGLSASDHQLIRIVSVDEKRADLLNRAGDYLGTIGDVTGDQERLNQNLGVLIMEKKR